MSDPSIYQEKYNNAQRAHENTTTLQNWLLQRKDFSFTSTVMDALKGMREIQVSHTLFHSRISRNGFTRIILNENKVWSVTLC